MGWCFAFWCPLPRSLPTDGGVSDLFVIMDIFQMNTVHFRAILCTSLRWRPRFEGFFGSTLLPHSSPFTSTVHLSFASKWSFARVYVAGGGVDCTICSGDAMGEGTRASSEKLRAGSQSSPKMTAALLRSGSHLALLSGSLRALTTLLDSVI